MKYVLIKHKNLKLLVNEGLPIQPLVENLAEIEQLAKEVSEFYKNLLNATDSEAKELQSRVNSLISKIDYKVIGVPFTNQDAELYALNKQLQFDELELTTK